MCRISFLLVFGLVEPSDRSVDEFHYEQNYRDDSTVNYSGDWSWINFFAESTIPRRVGDTDDWVDVATGDEHTCGVRADGSLWCWGDNSFDQTGQGDGEGSYHTPEQVGVATSWSSVNTGLRQTFGIQENDGLWAWGANTNGQLGLGHTTTLSVPDEIDDETSWKSVASAIDHSCGVHTNGSLWCWGRDGAYHRLGLGDDGVDSTTSPKQVSGDDWKMVSTEDRHNCAVRTGGQLACWGSTSSGALGLGEATEAEEPTTVGDDDDWSQVSVGPDHSCGVRTDETLWCWGTNYGGVLGGGTDDESETWKTPTENGDGWQQVSAAERHTCGIKTDATLWCWGTGEEGQLGLGDDVTVVYSPEQIVVGD